LAGRDAVALIALGDTMTERPDEVRTDSTSAGLSFCNEAYFRLRDLWLVDTVGVHR
jgi:hypothetical protein